MTYLNKRERNQMAHAMQSMPDKLKRELLGDNRAAFLRTFRDAFNATDGKGDPVWSARMAACEMYGRIEGMLGPTHQVLIGILGELGVSTRDELNELVESGRALKRSEQDVTKSLDEVFAEAMELAVSCIKLAPRLANVMRTALDAVAPGVRDAEVERSIESVERNVGSKVGEH